MRSSTIQDATVFVTAGEFVGVKNYKASSADAKVVALVTVEFAHLLRKQDSRVHRYTFAEVADLIESSQGLADTGQLGTVVSDLRSLHVRHVEALQAAATQH